MSTSSTILSYADDSLTVEQLSSSNSSIRVKSLDDHSSVTSMTDMENSSSQSEEMLSASLDFDRQSLGTDARHCRGLADSDDWEDSFAGEDSFAVHEGNGPYRPVAFRELGTVGEHEEEEDDEEESFDNDISTPISTETERN